MREDSLQRLAHANPVPEPLAAPPIAPLLLRLDQGEEPGVEQSGFAHSPSDASGQPLRRRWSGGGLISGIATALAVALTVALAVGALIVLRAHRAPVPGNPAPAARSQLLATLGVLRRAQTPADRSFRASGPPQPPSAPGAQIKVDRPLIRLARTAPWGAKVFLIPLTRPSNPTLARALGETAAVWAQGIGWSDYASASAIADGQAWGPAGTLRAKDGAAISRFFEVVPDGVAKVGFYTHVQLRPFRHRGLVTAAVKNNIAAFQLPGSSARRVFAVWYAPDGHVIKRVGDWSIANLPYRAPRANRTVTVPIASFQDATTLKRSLRDAQVPAMVQLLPRGEDCTAPPNFTPVPARSLPAFDPSKNPRANPPIDFGMDRNKQTTLILRYIPPHATLVIESQAQSGTLLARWPADKKGVALQPQRGRGIYVVWARGQVSPCNVVRTSNR